MGPNLFPEIPSLLRFIFYKCPILEDVSQAFLHITLESTDSDLTRFLWYRIVPNSQVSYDTTDEVITYRFTRLPFGLTCRSFLLSANIRTLATGTRVGRVTNPGHSRKVVIMDVSITSLV